MNAGKIDVLKRLLPEFKARGDRVLLFSQFTQILAILETVLQTMGIRYLLLTGSTPVNERQDMVDEFSNDPEITVFRAPLSNLMRTQLADLCIVDSALDTRWRPRTQLDGRKRRARGSARELP